MKKLLLISIISLSGCATSKITSFQGNQYTVCGNRFAANRDLYATIKAECGPKFQPLAGGGPEIGYVLLNKDIPKPTLLPEDVPCIVFECTKEK